MALLCASLLAHADDGHLQNAALVRAAESGVSLDTAAKDDAVCLGSIFINVDGTAVVLTVADLNDFHGGPDGTANELLGNAVTGENANLALGGRPAVTAHGREDERHTAALFDEINDRLGDDSNVGYSAAAAGNCYAHSGADTLAHLRTVELSMNNAGNFFRLKMAAVK